MSISRARVTAGLAAGAAGFTALVALLGGPATAQETPVTPPPPAAAAVASEPSDGENSKAGFGAMVSAAAESGPTFPPECGNFGRWVSAQARGIECSPPPADDGEG